MKNKILHMALKGLTESPNESPCALPDIVNPVVAGLKVLELNIIESGRKITKSLFSLMREV